jgi:DNA-binding response OmpR family regulator
MQEQIIPEAKPHILCTEDDADTREVIRLLLEFEGFHVTCADEPAHAISLATSAKFDLFLLDSWMPGMHGHVLCETLRELDSTVPILFYSGATNPSDRARAMAAGALGYVVKPGAPNELISEVRRLLRTKP